MTDDQALRRRLNAYAPYVGAGVVATRVSLDDGEIRVRMPLTERNVNLVGTHFGGSLYAMVDPHLMILLIARLGRDYVVWDRAAEIEFLRPGRGTVHATIRITDEEVAAIREATARGDKHLRDWHLEIVDDEGAVVATVRKTVYVRLARDPADR